MYDAAGYLERWLREVEVKRTMNTGSGMGWEKFTRHERRKLIKILNKLWGGQADYVTRMRVLDWLQRRDIPEGFLDDVDGTAKVWIETQFKPTFANALTFSAAGSDKISGMIDDINNAVGADGLFIVQNERIIEYIRVQGAELAVNITETQRQSLKAMLTESIEKGWSQTHTYDMMRKSMTLTNQETKWLSAYEKRIFDEQMKFFRKEFPGLSEAKIRGKASQVTERKVNLRFKRYQKDRAERITRTELKRAKHFGEIEAHRQAIENGVIKKAWKTWRRSSYNDPWASSIMFDGKKIPIEDSFFTHYGMPAKTTMTSGQAPGEINEHCFLEYKVEV